MDLYYSPIACSLAVHIALKELKLPHRLHRVHIQKGEHLGEDYRAINAQSLVPTLVLADGTKLTEVSAVLPYLNELSEDKSLFPRDSVERAEAASWLSFLSSQVHPTFMSFYHPERLIEDEGACAAMRAAPPLRFLEMLRQVESRLSEEGRALSSGPSLVDSFALVFYLWGLKMELPLTELPRYSRLVQAQLARPAVRAAMSEEGFFDLWAMLNSRFVGSAA